jgi:hypothetical protein
MFLSILQPPQASIVEAFQHFACLYIKYLQVSPTSPLLNAQPSEAPSQFIAWSAQIYTRLEECYDGMVHPQKRADVKVVLQYVIRRIIELKVLKTHYNTRHAIARVPAFHIHYKYRPHLPYPYSISITNTDRTTVRTLA